MCESDYASISCTINEQLLSYRDPGARDPGGRTGELKAQKNNPQHIQRIESKLDAIMLPIAEQTITDINDGKCVKEISLQCLFERRIATAWILMHKNLKGVDNRARECGLHRTMHGTILTL